MTLARSEQAEAVLRAAELLHDGAAVELAITRMAEQISERLAQSMPLVLTVMVGGLIPAGKLLPQLRFPLEMDYIHATRYRGETSGGELLWLARPQAPLAGRTVLVIDDILDEGHTLAGILDDCRAQGAKEVLSAVLVDKRHERRFQNLQADFVGLEVDDRYVFGAGMDYKGLCRNLPGIYAAQED
ncbi:hypoxanthine-guanine phosphoribosyltransferase [Alkalilimnicola sp. S0819]|uniref:hypoxanthine-guanine phosphoribosyltransferase n=1 Tax=Alkalilimnicola sp. S0819 TaxID=2613922 RepID=UPI0012621699|nr:hypoxanthine-guanine phosphoribosyltransferase [Alkalilimnicola sp. S0819]KAB7627456.1 hypoxanthine-guanine phosphoribosyltransferase [Alkalilimnicola sp. S0819]MPQ15605.1 hypoxanthine-guanine phosphoribosyltransferase [Alkalilimnicola sp. S0819]